MTTIEPYRDLDYQEHVDALREHDEFIAAVKEDRAIAEGWRQEDCAACTERVGHTRPACPEPCEQEPPLPCRVDTDHCWGHHPGSADCLKFRPRACTNEQIIANQRDADFEPGEAAR